MAIPYLETYLQKLGLSIEATKIYMALSLHGQQNISDIARNSGIERTKVYRVLPELEQVSLITVSSEYKLVLVAAAPIDNVQLLIAKQEQVLSDLKGQLPDVERALAGANHLGSNKAAVRMYRGSDGIKQMLWNETKASSELLSILRYGIQIKTRLAFFDRWTKACNQKNLNFRSVVNPNFQHGQAAWHKKHVSGKLDNWTGKVIDPESFLIKQNIIIYDDVVGFFDWGEDAYGIEIQSPSISQTHRQLFELLWTSADSRQNIR